MAFNYKLSLPSGRSVSISSPNELSDDELVQLSNDETKAHREENLAAAKKENWIKFNTERPSIADALAGLEGPDMTPHMGLQDEDRVRFKKASVGDEITMSTGDKVIKVDDSNFALPNAWDQRGGIATGAAANAIPGLSALATGAMTGAKLGGGIAGTIGGAVVGAATALGAKYLQNKGLEAIAPELLAEEQKTAERYPIGYKVGSVAASGMKPDLLAPIREKLLNAGIGTGIEGAMQIVQGRLGDEGSLKDLLMAGGENALMGANALGHAVSNKAGSFVTAKTPAQTAIEAAVIKAREEKAIAAQEAAKAEALKQQAASQSDVVTALGDVSAGEHLATATATANKTATRIVTPPEPLELKGVPQPSEPLIAAEDTALAESLKDKDRTAAVDNWIKKQIIPEETGQQAFRGKLAGELLTKDNLQAAGEAIDARLAKAQEEARIAEEKAKQKLEAGRAESFAREFADSELAAQHETVVDEATKKAFEAGVQQAKMAQAKLAAEKLGNEALTDEAFAQGAQNAKNAISKLSEIAPKEEAKPTEAIKPAEQSKPATAQEVIAASDLPHADNVSGIVALERAKAPEAPVEKSIEVKPEPVAQEAAPVEQPIINIADTPAAKAKRAELAKKLLERKAKVEAAKAAEKAKLEKEQADRLFLTRGIKPKEQGLGEIAPETPPVLEKAAEAKQTTKKQLLEKNHQEANAELAALDAKIEAENAAYPEVVDLAKSLAERGIIHPKQAKEVESVANETKDAADAANVLATALSNAKRKGYVGKAAKAEPSKEAPVASEPIAQEPVKQPSESAISEQGRPEDHRLLLPQEKIGSQDIVPTGNPDNPWASVDVSRVGKKKNDGEIIYRQVPSANKSLKQMVDLRDKLIKNKKSVSEPSKSSEALIGESGITDEAINAQKQKVKDIEENIDFANDEATDPKISNYRKTLAKNVLESSRKQLAIENEKLDAMVNVRKQEVAANEQIQEAKQSKQDRLLEDFQTKAITKDEYLEMGGDPKALPKTKERKRGYGNEAGFGDQSAMVHSGASIIGAGIGYAIGDTPEEKAMYAAIGAGLGLGSAKAALKALAKKNPAAAANIQKASEQAKKQQLENIANPPDRSKETQLAIDSMIHPSDAKDLTHEEIAHNKIWTPAMENHPFLGEIAERVNSVSDNVGEVAPEMKGTMRDMERDKIRMNSDDLNRSLPALKALRELVGDKTFEGPVAELLFNNDEKHLIDALKGLDGGPEIIKGLEDGWFKVRNEKYQALREAFPEKTIGELDNYWHREVVDHHALRKAIDAADPSFSKQALDKARQKKRDSAIEEALDAKKESTGDENAVLTDKEKQEVYNKSHLTNGEEARAITDALFSPTVSGKGGAGGATRSRKLQDIAENLIQYYEPPDVGMVKYLTSTNQTLNTRKYMGKVNDDAAPVWAAGQVDGGIFGKQMADRINSGTISEEGQKRIERNLNAYLKIRKANKFADPFVSKAGYVQVAANLGQLTTALVQLADVFPDLAGLGVKAAIKGYGKAYFKAKGRKTLEDVGLEEGSPEIYEFSKKSGFAEKLLNHGILSLMKITDRMGKEGHLNAVNEYMKQNIEAAKSGDETRSNFKRISRQYQEQFGTKEWEKVIDAYDKGDLNSEAINKFNFNQLADVQPIAKSEMATGKLEAEGISRLAWGLTGFSLRAMSNARRNFVSELRNGRTEEAYKWLAGYVVAQGLAGAVMGAVKDWKNGNDADIQSNLFGAVLQMLSLNRVAVNEITGNKWGDLVADRMYPGLIGVAKDTSHDLGYIAGQLRGENESGPTSFFKNSELLKRATPVGDLIYRNWGLGEAKNDKLQRSRVQQKSDLMKALEPLTGTDSHKRR